MTTPTFQNAYMIYPNNKPFIKGATPAIRLLAFLALFITGMLSSAAQKPSELPNPNIGNPNNFVADPYNHLSERTKHYINSKLSDLRKKTTVEGAVAIINTTGDLSIEDYAYELFSDWGIGQTDVENGILLVLAVDDLTARIEVGSGAEGVVTDIAAAKMLHKGLVPPMREGNINQGVSNTVDMIYDACTAPDIAEELRSDHQIGAMARVRVIDKEIIFNFLWVLAVCVFLFTLGMFIIDFLHARKRDNYRRAMTWRPHLPVYWMCAVLSCGLALPLAFIAWRLYRHSRDKREICDTCGAKMNKLSEEEDNAFLSASQDFEEKLGTVDYDVWLCPECGTVERFPYVERQLKYRKCPDCGTIAMNLVMDKVVDPPTTRKEGHGERVYQCQFCRHTHREGYTIPRKTDAAAAAIAAGAVAGMMRGSSSGGGGFTGGFGGGHSSGGGATGRW